MAYRSLMLLSCVLLACTLVQGAVASSAAVRVQALVQRRAMQAARTGDVHVHGKGGNTTYAIQCQLSSFWVLLPIARALVDQWLAKAPANVTYGTHPFTTVPADQWPIFLEFNEPTNCFETILPFIKTTFHEFKLQIPFLAQPGLRAPLMFKPLIIEDNIINAISSQLVYGLHAVPTTHMAYDAAGAYSIEQGLNASFTALGEWQAGAATPYAYAPFDYLSRHSEWLGHDLFGNQRCAQNLYDNVSVRQVSGVLHMAADFLPGQPATVYTFGDAGAGGLNGIQITADQFITGLHNCPTADANA